VRSAKLQFKLRYSAPVALGAKVRVERLMKAAAFKQDRAAGKEHKRILRRRSERDRDLG
jgi:hypothetical protein